MSPDQIRRSWDDDDTPRSVFPEPLAERLTRENKELRAEVERWRKDWQGALDDARRYKSALDALVADLRGLADRWWNEAEYGDARPSVAHAMHSMVQELLALTEPACPECGGAITTSQGRHEARCIRAACRYVGPGAVGAVLDKHAGERAHEPAVRADDCYCPDDHASWCPNLRSDKHAGEQPQGGEGS